MFGVLAINKPSGLTSRDVVNRIQKLCRPHKVGHTGTLDPLATGVLLVAVGNATRLVEFSHALKKSYEAVFRIGCRSDTLDVEGEVVPLPDSSEPSLQEFVDETQKWIGKVQQVPPKYSAIQVDGKRAYELARRGADFELPSRTVEIMYLNVDSYQYPLLNLRIECGSGTYIRSLGSDLARGLKTDAVMVRLERTRIGTIGIERCISLEDLGSRQHVLANLLPPQTLVSHMATVVLKSQGCHRIRNGIPVTHEDLLQLVQGGEGELAAVDETGQLIAILQPAGPDRYRSRKVFQAAQAVSQPPSNKTPQMPES